MSKREFTRTQGRLLAGRLVESAVGAYLAGAAAAGECVLHYCRDRNREVNFVVEAGRHPFAIEVKSSRRRDVLAGLDAFGAVFKTRRTLLVGPTGSRSTSSCPGP